ncbi:hypothetical protein BDB00DRAFT_940047 [Zychaea mexicana]|uniref:uncharacterized protein n=1 Tax=Zychaea mexicana TaxID=64656 RepID=UPI0022FDE1E3|nr:uncharacterized protein BDB00DRAFT_940047 [Zychaea mexicana]KAI9491918.1 hypothetical protein BDB00DRAFT_940047 [Zychaea mexicana]
MNDERYNKDKHKTNKQTIALPNNNNNLLVSTSVALVKTQLYECWLQVYGPLFWIVSAMLCLCSTTTRTITTATEANCNRSSRRSSNSSTSTALRSSEARRRSSHQQQQDFVKAVTPKLNVPASAPQPKKSLRRSLKLHMQSLKHSLNEVVMRTARLRRSNKRRTSAACSFATSSTGTTDEPSPVHPLDADTQQQQQQQQQRSTRRRRKSFAGYYSSHPIFNPFRRKTAPELVDCSIDDNNNSNSCGIATKEPQL